ncbi:YjbH domain-containing protein [Escherichia coli]
MTLYFNNLRANYFADLGNGFYGQVYRGCLETMYAGVGFRCFIAR